MSVKMKFGSKDIPFVYKGDKLVYPNPIKDGLLLWYDFKGIRNTDANKELAKDLSGNGNDGTLTNFNFTEGSGYKDNTLVFDGVDDGIETGAKTAFDNLGGITIDVWANVEELQRHYRLVDKNWRAFSLAVWNSGVINFNVGGLSIQNNFSISKIRPKTIFNVVAIYNDETNEVSIYLDGVKDYGMSVTGNIDNSIDPLRFGCQINPGQELFGSVHSAKIYNRPLTPEEIAHNYAIEKERFNIL